MVVACLNSLVQPLAKVGEEDRYMPEGFCDRLEAKLDEASGFLTEEQGKDVADWWVSRPPGRKHPQLVHR